jgi:hypothetical protein
MKGKLGRLVQKAVSVICESVKIFDAKAFLTTFKSRLLHFWNVIAMCAESAILQTAMRLRVATSPACISAHHRSKTRPESRAGQNMKPTQIVKLAPGLSPTREGWAGSGRIQNRGGKQHDRQHNKITRNIDTSTTFDPPTAVEASANRCLY